MIKQIGHVQSKKYFHDVWYNQSVINVDDFIINFTQRMKDTFLTEVNAFFNDSSKCAMYLKIYIQVKYVAILFRLTH